MLRFKYLSLDNWERWGNDILESDKVFPGRLRWREEFFLANLVRGDTIAKVLELSGEFIGTAMGHGAYSVWDFYLEKLDGFSFKGKRVIYLTNLVVKPESQKQGYGTMLLEDFIGESRNAGYDTLTGIFRPFTSLPMMRRRGAREVCVFLDYGGSGEDCTFCELPI